MFFHSSSIEVDWMMRVSIVPQPARSFGGRMRFGRSYALVNADFLKFLPSDRRGGEILTFVLLGLLAIVQPGGGAGANGMVFTASPAVASGNAAAMDPRVGSWTLISADATLDPPNKLTITSHREDVHVVMSGETHLDFMAKANGHDTAVAGNPAFDQVEMRKIDGKQAEVTEKKGGIVVATILEKVSKDRKELTVTTTRKGRPEQITVWTRTGGAKAVGDPVAGEWTQDLSKTRLRQEPLLKIESDGNGGVRFLGDFSYTARFDGKPYELKNSRNDTVTLQLVDSHTVDSFYRRDDQVTQKDRWVVSADGQQMTLTSSGTFETGQRLVEKLVFKRQ
jgi:hypothetical protein